MAETTVRVRIPAGAVHTIVLQGVELGHGEGITIQVLVNAGDGSRVLLGSASMVGRRQEQPAQPFYRTTLLVPLDERAARLIAGRDEVELTLRAKNNPARAPIRVGQVYFRAGAAE